MLGAGRAGKSDPIGDRDGVYLHPRRFQGRGGEWGVGGEGGVNKTRPRCHA